MKEKHLLVLLILLIASIATEAQFTMQQKNSTIDSVLKALNDRYVFPDVAKEMETHIRDLQSRKVYDTISDGNVFAQKLTQDLRSISKDLHLRINYSAETLPPEESRELMSMPASTKDGYGKMLKHMNYGIRKLDVVKGNIGYIDMDFFCSPEFAGDTYAAAMNYLSHTEAVIIDLRNCGGSMSPDAIPFICSYFFQEPVHLNDLYWRKGNNTTQSWTYSYVPGKKFPDKPIYVLTSNKTFSGAEELAYDLQNLKRATIIGETTGGGANPGGDVRITDHFRMFIPIGRAINPITKTNWEGVGVKPDTLINSKFALYKAQQLALQNAINKADEPEWKNFLQDCLKEVESNKPVLKPVTFELKGFDNATEVYVTGSFNDWSSRSLKMEHKGDKWIATAESEAGKLSYKFIVDGNWITDPANNQTEKDGQNTNSVKTVE